MKIYLLLLVLVSGSFASHTEASDIRKYIDKMKMEVRRILGKKPATMTVTMPAIPVVKKDATSMRVYDKSGNIFDQGKEFTKLSTEDKREYNLAFLRELYVAVRGAEAKTSELVSNINALEQGGSRESVYRSIVLSPDYLSLESIDEKPNLQLVNYTVKFGEKYLAIKFRKSEIQSLNLYSIKRVFTGKALEVIDAFPRDGKDLYSWYALLSEDLAKNHDNVFKSKIRKKRDASHHYSWAKKVPFQHIKSEVIVKLHKVMNSF